MSRDYRTIYMCEDCIRSELEIEMLETALELALFPTCINCDYVINSDNSLGYSECSIDIEIDEGTKTCPRQNLEYWKNKAREKIKYEKDKKNGFIK